jgi:hypothetical protein
MPLSLGSAAALAAGGGSAVPQFPDLLEEDVQTSR